jgi:acetyl-CoA carboxylase biotin carboxylase subunit
MISKMIVWAKDRESAIQRMKRALDDYVLTGIKTSLPFLKKVMEAPDFVNGKYNTQFIEKNMDILMPDNEPSQEETDMAAIAAFIDFLNQEEKAGASVQQAKEKSFWKEFGRRKGVLRL